MAKTTRKRGRPPGVRPTAGRDPNYLSGAQNLHYSIQDMALKPINSALNIVDDEKARGYVDGVVTASFMSRFGGSMVEIEAQIELVGRELEGFVKRLLHLRQQDAHTPQWIQAAGVNDNREDGEQVELAFADWQLRHRIEAPILVVTMLLTFFGSYFTAHSNLVGTGLVVFLETPVAWFMAGMAPLAGLALKLFGSNFRTDRGHHRFMIALFTFAVMLAMAWAGLFATLYHGLSADGLGGGLFDEPTLWDRVKDTIFIFVTLATEITLSAALASRLDRIARIYSPDFWHRNPESVTIQQDIADTLDRVTKLTDRIATLRGDLALYRHSLDLQVEMAQLALASRRDRNNNTDLI